MLQFPNLSEEEDKNKPTSKKTIIKYIKTDEYVK